MDPLALIDACERCYDSPMFTAGPSGRDGCTVTSIGGRDVLIFRGTLTDGPVGFLDWLNDLRAALVYRAAFPGLIHHGFAASMDDLLPWLAQYQFQRNLVITGHSKGGALAILAGHLYRDLHPEVIAFAAPKVGNRAFLAGYCVRATVYENPHDVVPTLPPFPDYRAVGDLVGPEMGWEPPHGVEANHALETGYRPWISRQLRPANVAA